MAGWVSKYKREMSPKLKISADVSTGLGKYTGNGGVNEPVGVVHGQEYVVSEPIVKALGGAQQIEKVLAQYLQGRGAPGFQTGGGLSGLINREVTERTGEPSAPYAALAAKYTPNAAQLESYRQSAIKLGAGATPVTPTAIPGVTTTFSSPAALNTTPDVTTTVPAPAAPNTGFTGVKTTRLGDMTTGDLPSYMQPGVTSARTVDKQAANLQTANWDAQYPGTGEQVDKQAANLALYGPPPAFPTPVTPAVPPAEQPTLGDRAVQAGLGGMFATAAGESPYWRKASEAYLGMMRAGNAADKAAYQQELAQMGLSPEAAAAHMSLLGRQQRSEESQLAGEMALGAAKSAEAAGGQLASFGQAQQEYELSKKKYGDEAVSIAANDAMNLSYDTWQAKHPDMTKDDYNMMRTFWEQNKQIGDISVKAAEVGLTTSQYGLVSNLVGQGFSLAQVNEALASQGISLDPTQYASVLEATALGERNYNRRMSMANMLFEAGGADNISAGIRVLSESFPGLDVNWAALESSLTTADKQKSFGDAMSTLTTLVATPGMTAGTAIAFMEQNGQLAALGMDAADAQSLFAALDVNMIDESWNAIEDSDWYQGLSDPNSGWYDPDTAMFVKDLFSDIQSGALELENAGIEYVLNPTTGEYEFQVVDDTGTTAATVPTDAEWEEMGDAQKWDSYSKTVPSALDADELYDQWVLDGMPKTYDEQGKPPVATGDGIGTIATSGNGASLTLGSGATVNFVDGKKYSFSDNVNYTYGGTAYTLPVGKYTFKNVVSTQPSGEQVTHFVLVDANGGEHRIGTTVPPLEGEE